MICICALLCQPKKMEGGEVESMAHGAILLPYLLLLLLQNWGGFLTPDLNGIPHVCKRKTWIAALGRDMVSLKRVSSM